MSLILDELLRRQVVGSLTPAIAAERLADENTNSRNHIPRSLASGLAPRQTLIERVLASTWPSEELVYSQALLLGLRRSWFIRRRFYLRCREERFIDLRIHHDLFDDDFLWRNGAIPKSWRLLGQWKNSRLQNVRNL